MMSPIPSLPVRGAWIEIPRCRGTRHQRLSLPVRGAWIEIRQPSEIRKRQEVAPRAGSVD